MSHDFLFFVSIFILDHFNFYGPLAISSSCLFYFFQSIWKI